MTRQPAPRSGEDAGESPALQTVWVDFELHQAAGRALVQKAQRFAWIGISLRHSGHFFVVGSAGGSLREREMSALTGSTTM